MCGLTHGLDVTGVYAGQFQIEAALLRIFEVAYYILCESVSEIGYSRLQMRRRCCLPIIIGKRSKGDLT